MSKTEMNTYYYEVFDFETVGDFKAESDERALEIVQSHLNKKRLLALYREVVKEDSITVVYVWQAE